MHVGAPYRPIGRLASPRYISNLEPLFHSAHTAIMISRLARPLRTQLRTTSRQLRQSSRPYSSGSSSGGSDLPWLATGIAIFVPTTAYIIYSWKFEAPPAPKKKEAYEVPALPPIDATEVTANVSKKAVDALEGKEAAFKKESDSAEDPDKDAVAQNEKSIEARDDGADDKKNAATHAAAVDEDSGHQKQAIKELRKEDKAEDGDLKEQRTKAQAKDHPDDTHTTEKTSETVPAKDKPGQDVEPKKQRDEEAEERLQKEKKLDKESDDYVEKESWADEQVQK